MAIGIVQEAIEVACRERCSIGEHSRLVLVEMEANYESTRNWAASLGRSKSISHLVIGHLEYMVQDRRSS